MRVGMIGRADNGGLGSMTWEFARHLNPDRVVLMDLRSAGRGEFYPERYSNVGEILVCTGTVLTDEAMEWLFAGSDIVYTAETAYREDFWAAAKRRDVRTVLHAMPELLSPQSAPDVMWLPTLWSAGRVRRPWDLVPVPVALDRIKRRYRKTADCFFHVGSTAMEDRNGTNIVVAAIPHVEVDCVLAMHTPFMPVNGTDVVMVERSPGGCDNYWDVIPPTADVLVAPRRYAGLSLSLQEGLARGMPVIVLETDPYSNERGSLSVLAEDYVKPRRALMKGGEFHVHDADPVDVARAMDRLASDPQLVSRLSGEAMAFGDDMGWDQWTDIYRRKLEVIAG